MSKMCDKCGNKLTLLFIHAVCDYCDPPTNSVASVASVSCGSDMFGFSFVLRGVNHPSFREHVFKTREDAEKYLSVLAVGHSFDIIQVTHGLPFVWTAHQRYPELLSGGSCTVHSRYDTKYHPLEPGHCVCM